MEKERCSMHGEITGGASVAPALLENAAYIVAEVKPFLKRLLRCGCGEIQAYFRIENAVTCGKRVM